MIFVRVWLNIQSAFGLRCPIFVGYFDRISARVVGLGIPNFQFGQLAVVLDSEIVGGPKGLIIDQPNYFRLRPSINL